MRLMCHFELRGKWGRGLDFKEKVDSSQVDEREQTFDKQIFPEHQSQKQCDTEGNLSKQTLLGFSLFTIPSS